jgi:Putative excisionase (DUF1233)
MTYVKAKALTEKTQLCTRTFSRLRASKTWEEGIHFFRISKSLILYNLPLIEDWIANSQHPEHHEKAIENFLASLPSSQPRNKKADRKQPTTLGRLKNV